MISLILSNSWLIGLGVFLFGLCIGSFLNVVIYRYNTGLSIVSGRSQCFSCGRTLEWYDLIPVFSFLFSGGRCRVCGSKISWQYALVELATGLMFLGLWFYEGISWAFLLDMVIWSILIVIFVYDFRHKIIPDGLVGAFIALGYAKLFVLTPMANWWTGEMIIALLAGPILFVPFWALWSYSGGAWMGLGDGKFAIGMGAYLGLVYGLSAIVLAFWIGAAVSLLYLGTQKLVKVIHGKIGRLSFLSNRLTMKSEIPFAPFLIIALGIVFFCEVNVLLLNIFLI